MRFLFVVHRYYPFPGGSEVYVRSMAEEMLSRGHYVEVLTGQHQGDQNGVRVGSDFAVLHQPWDLIIVHGGDVYIQNVVLANAHTLSSPTLYMLILPSKSPVCLQGMTGSKFLGWSTNADYEHIKSYGLTHKARQIRHGIQTTESIGTPGFKHKYDIPTDKKMFLSCGGYWPNKRMKELAEIFAVANPSNSILVTTGYDNSHNLAPFPTDNIIPLMVPDRSDVMSAIYEADCYVMHSSQEGYGLVLLESMLNKTPWIATNIAGAATLKRGLTYDTDDQLVDLLRIFDYVDEVQLEDNKQYVLDNHTMQNTVDDILACVT